jgi:hypothetical protein
MEDLKFKIQYNFAHNVITLLASISDFKEEGSVNCSISRDSFLSDPIQTLQSSLNMMVQKLCESYSPIEPLALKEVLDTGMINELHEVA